MSAVASIVCYERRNKMQETRREVVKIRLSGSRILSWTERRDFLTEYRFFKDKGYQLRWHGRSRNDMPQARRGHSNVTKHSLRERGLHQFEVQSFGSTPASALEGTVRWRRRRRRKERWYVTCTSHPLDVIHNHYPLRFLEKSTCPRMK